MLTDDDHDVHLTVDISEPDATGARSVALGGDLDLAGAVVLETALADLEESAPLVLDLSAIEFVDSSGIRALLVARTSRPVTLVAPSRVVEHTFEVANVTHLLESP